MIKAFENYEVWFVTGAQLLYGGDAVKQVDGHSKEMVDGLNDSGNLPVKVIYKGTANNTHEVEDIMVAANADKHCIGVITWMHTFSPAKMWIHGLQKLQKPLLHLHTQYNKTIPYDTMDMDFMNLNQSAHGDREYAHILTRLRKPRKTVIGYWKDAKTQEHIAVWERVCAGWADAHDCLILRFGDQMNNVAVTDGDKVAFEQVFGYHVDYCPFSTVMTYFDKVKDEDVTALVHDVYFKQYTVKDDLKDEKSEGYRKIWNSAKAELTIRAVLEDFGAKGFTTNFDDLGDANVEETGRGFDQIPGLASQRLMHDGYGFGAEGDWKSACLYRTTWFMSQGIEGGTSFLEDYTLNFDGDKTSILESHMLEVNPDISEEEKPRLEVHFLGIGIRKSQTARLVFTTKQGRGITATVVDLGNRFRLIANDVNLIKSKPLPKLPVASALWIPEPTFEVGVGCWMNAGGTHHSCFSFALSDEYWRDFAEIADVEACIINKDTDYEQFRKELRWNEVYYMLNKSLR
ncbi:L-arabinose isomerase [Prevotella lacticifex]|jgi:L-arabinose isomerase|uniref:L-arabinose isomerase n=1 Tax=Prevotella lacticifex TaxID=2854755 RepID=A0A9R1C957_9BACT|nr:L-arabinose isomerase [Prevotella lacticifex]GJG35121.1 L-arabinose isomerase [Prevotella lacticifex]GJG39828.1 L-arabinose isomerase [Prevotella lacticifex]GJG41490.1 L-arabinose isomerase [Prevotella lacticifex]GJG46182.1 L-arabinose isomerase [Prevotella lacticifex]GJG47842.1 L-arabinose isomerase [Prevotella lacticifex]